MAGICSGARKGMPLLGEGEGEGEVQLTDPTDPTEWFGPSPSASPLAVTEEATKPARVRAIRILCCKTKTQYPVAGPVQNPFKLCDFSLVTSGRLLY
jgi:hypothetical protein